MQKFEPGDIVTIKTKFDHNDRHGPGFNKAMERYKGGTYKVIKTFDYTKNWYVLEALNNLSTGFNIGAWVWSGEWLESAQVRPSITEIL